MRQSSHRLLATVAAIALYPGAAVGGTDNATFYQNERDGYYFYEDPPADEAPAEVDPAESPQEQQSKPAETEEKPTEPKGPQPMSAEWIDQHMDEFRQRAIDNPTEKNVRAYLYLQKAAMDKASRFADVSAEVTVSDPYLDAKSRAPTATYAVNDAQRQAQERSQTTLKALGQDEDVGLLFVFSSTCPHCRTMAPVLKRFSELYELPIRAVSIDGQHMPDKPFPDAAYDPSLVERLGIDKTPATLLVRPPEEMVPLAHGALSLQGLQKRTILVAQREGWIDRETYEGTTSVEPVDPETAIDPAREGERLDAPDKLIRYIRNQTGGEL